MSHHPYVAGALDDTRLFVREFIVVGEAELDAIVLWNAHTYVFDTSRATQYLNPFSPEPGSGKTTLLEVLEAVSVMVAPVMPTVANEIRAQLGLARFDWKVLAEEFDGRWPGARRGLRIGEGGR